MAATMLLVRALLASRRGTAVVLGSSLVLCTAATIAGLSLRDASRTAWDEAVAVTRAADVRIVSFDSASVEAALRAIPGVEAVSRSTLHFTHISTGDERAEVRVVITPPDPVVDVPVAVAGRWPGDGIAVERSFAAALGVDAGDLVTVASRTTRVAAVVVSAAQAPYPGTVPGVAFVPPELATRLGLDDVHGFVAAVRTSGGTEAAAGPFIPPSAGGPRPAILQSADEIQADVLATVTDAQVVLTTFALLLLVGVGGVVATAVGGRARADVGMLRSLRAAGAGPAHVVLAYTAEHVVVAAGAAAVGAAVAVLAVPPLAASALPPVGFPPSGPPPWIAASGALLTVASTGLVAALSARGVLRSLQRTRAVGSRGAARVAGWLARHGAPVPAVLAAGDVLARPGRAALGVVGVALAVTAAVATLGMESTIAAEEAVGRLSDGAALRRLVYPLQVAVGIVALVQLLVLAGVDAAERRRELVLLRAVGVTPAQLLWTRWIGMAALAAAATLVGVPAGIGLFTAAYGVANGSTEGAVGPAGAVVAALAVVAVTACGLAGVAASHGAARRSPASLLAAE